LLRCFIFRKRTSKGQIYSNFLTVEKIGYVFTDIILTLCSLYEYSHWPTTKDLTQKDTGRRVITLFILMMPNRKTLKKT
jgi:hypothetical protein